MNKEQEAFEKWAKHPLREYKLGKWNDRYLCYENTVDAHTWQAWQARAALDKQDSLEIVKEIDALYPRLKERVSYFKEPEETLIYKIRNHLTNKE